MNRVEEARRSFKESLEELKGSVDRRTGLGALTGGSGMRRGWIVGAVALAAGLALGVSLRRKVRRRRGTR